jgi:hypothetical protein
MSGGFETLAELVSHIETRRTGRWGLGVEVGQMHGLVLYYV